VNARDEDRENHEAIAALQADLAALEKHDKRVVKDLAAANAQITALSGALDAHEAEVARLTPLLAAARDQELRDNETIAALRADSAELNLAKDRITQLEAALREALAFDPYADDWDIHIEAWLLAMTRALAGSAAREPSTEMMCPVCGAKQIWAQWNRRTCSQCGHVWDVEPAREPRTPEERT
jgi:DNA repair exonuclease SbcCD ATPase subunit